MSTFTCNSVSTLIQNFFYFVIFCNGGNKKFFQDYVKNILLGVQHINYVRSDSEHTVISVPNKQVLNNVIDTFKQKSGIAFAIYRKPKDFGDRGEKIRYFRHHIIIFKFRNQTNCTIFRDQTKKFFFFLKICQKNRLSTWNTGTQRNPLQYFLWFRKQTRHMLFFREFILWTATMVQTGIS